jgi:asparagine synthase (glutamine-hydrolysing)
MCGIAGWIEWNGQVNRPLFDQMRDTLAHRGPDGAGSHFTADGRVALGHRRLAFLDLTDAGLQPMGLPNRELWITLNGEIYNYRELRTDLLAFGHIFQTQTDTEVLLHGYVQWGMDGLLAKLHGMFAFALYDGDGQKLHLVRDRFGIKPLYYHQVNERLIFASELKAIMASGLVPKEVDMAAFADYFVYRYVPSPYTIWKTVKKLPPAHRLEVSMVDGTSTLHQYWKLSYGSGRCDPQDLASDVGKLLATSVNEHSRSDVEIGAFLSGGYDSSAIVMYLAQQQTGVKAFSIGFKDWENSEDNYAAIVADHLHADLTTMKADNTMMGMLPLMPDVYDEPIADISILPTYLVSQLAAQKVKAVMSGEGADELFGGYNWQKEYYARWHPHGWKDKLRLLAKNPTPTAVEDYAGYMSMGRFNTENLQEMLCETHHDSLRSDADWFYRQHYTPELTPLRSIQHMDIKCFMGELVLTKIDRASMAHSLEVRVPFLDHRLFEKVFRYREEVCYNPSTTKYLLYENIKDHLPKSILNRGKQGFVGPDDVYMDVKFYQELLIGGKLIEDGIIQHRFVDRLLVEKDHWRLWKLAVMEHWWRKWMS